MIEQLPESSGKYLGFRMSGKLHDADYKTFVPVVDVKGRRVVLDLPADFFEVPAQEEEEAAELQESAP